MAMQFSEEDKEKLKNDSSEIYRKRTEETNRQDIEQLTGKARWQHFADYYLKIVVVVVVVAAILIVGLVRSVTNRTSTALYIAIQNDAFDEKKIEAFEEAIGEYLKINPDKEIVVVNTACSDQQLQTFFYAGTADILITDAENFEHWGAAQYFYDSEHNKEVSFYKDYDEKYLYRTKYITGEDVLNNKEKEVNETEASDQTAYNCGIYLTDSEKYRQIGGGLDYPVLGIANTTENLAEAKAFAKFMMDNSQKMELDVKNEKN
ncbi:MAG: hypothetical protein SO170_09515 [Butyribacter sp.]|nr:hypothetical protein [bacterium]MDY3855173.1 hypothetical protein [Butyribacter sp.]